MLVLLLMNMAASLFHTQRVGLFNTCEEIPGTNNQTDVEEKLH